jgi:hypothetical protein
MTPSGIALNRPPSASELQRTYDLGAQQASLGASLEELLRFVNHALDAVVTGNLKTLKEDLGVLAGNAARAGQTALAARAGDLGLAGHTVHDLLEGARPGCVAERHEVVMAFVQSAAEDGFRAWERGDAFGDLDVEAKRFLSDLHRSLARGIATNRPQGIADRIRTRRFAAEVRRRADEDEDEDTDEVMSELAEWMAWRMRNEVLATAPRESAEVVGFTGQRLHELVEGLASYVDGFIAEFEEDMSPCPPPLREPG